ncbi:MAG TPA: hypothetical protein VF229_01905, partial [Burkholderiaceae bacterium]
MPPTPHGLSARLAAGALPPLLSATLAATLSTALSALLAAGAVAQVTEPLARQFPPGSITTRAQAERALAMASEADRRLDADYAAER